MDITFAGHTSAFYLLEFQFGAIMSGGLNVINVWTLVLFSILATFADLKEKAGIHRCRHGKEDDRVKAFATKDTNNETIGVSFGVRIELY